MTDQVCVFVLSDGSKCGKSPGNEDGVCAANCECGVARDHLPTDSCHPYTVDTSAETKAEPESANAKAHRLLDELIAAAPSPREFNYTDALDAAIDAAILERLSGYVAETVESSPVDEETR